MNEDTIRKVADWIMANRRGPSFNYEPNKIVNLIRDSMKQDVFVISHKGPKITGIACGERNDEEHYVKIHDVLTTEPGIVKKFVEYCMSKYPGYAIYGSVRGRDRLINNPMKFARRLK